MDMAESPRPSLAPLPATPTGLVRTISMPMPAEAARPRTLRLFLAVFVVLLCLDLPGSWLIDPDESRYAEIPREMLASGDFVTPTLNGAHYFEKPPLFYWLNAGSIALFGHSSFAARLPVRLAALGTAAILAAGLRSVAPGAGLWAALVFLSAQLSFALGRYNIIDGLLSFTLTLSFFSLRGILLQPEPGRKLRHEIGLGAGTGA